jgi:hypothetical protein
MTKIETPTIETPTSDLDQATRLLREDEFASVTGGQINALTSAVSEVMKNFGGALNTAARGG